MKRNWIILISFACGLCFALILGCQEKKAASRAKAPAPLAEIGGSMVRPGTSLSVELAARQQLEADARGKIASAAGAKAGDKPAKPDAKASTMAKAVRTSGESNLHPRGRYSDLLENLDAAVAEVNVGVTPPNTETVPANAATDDSIKLSALEGPELESYDIPNEVAGNWLNATAVQASAQAGALAAVPAESGRDGMVFSQNLGEETGLDLAASKGELPAATKAMQPGEQADGSQPRAEVLFADSNKGPEYEEEAAPIAKSEKEAVAAAAGDAAGNAGSAAEAGDKDEGAAAPADEVVVADAGSPVEGATAATQDSIPAGTPSEKAIQDKAQELANRALIRKEANKADAKRSVEEGKVLFNSQAFDSALDCFEAALALDPDSPEAMDWTQKTRSLLNRTGKDARADDLQRTVKRAAVERTQYDMEVRAAVGKAEELLLRAKGMDDRKRIMDEAARFSDSLSDIGEALKQLDRADLLLQGGSVMEEASAAELKRRSIELRKDLEVARSSIAANLEEYRLRVAKESQAEAAKESDTFHAAKIAKLVDSAKYHMDRQQYDKAMEFAEKAMAEDANNAEALKIYRDARNRERLRRDYDNTTNLRTSDDAWRVMGLREAIQSKNPLEYPPDWEQIKKRVQRVSVNANLSPWEAALAEKLENTNISMEFEGSPLKEVIDHIKSKAQVNIIAHKSVDLSVPVNIRLHDINVGAALDWVLKNLDYHREMRYGAIFITKEPKPDLVMRLYPVYDLTHRPNDYKGPDVNSSRADLSSTSSSSSSGSTDSMWGDDDDDDDDQPVEEESLPDRVKRLIDPESWTAETNISIWQDSLLVMQSAEVHGKINEFLIQLRASSKQQVLVDSRFIDVNDTFLEQIGVTWYNATSEKGIAGTKTQANSKSVTYATQIRPGAGAYDSDTGGLNLNYKYANGDSLSPFEVNALLTAVRNGGQGSVLHNPKLLVANGRRAYMEISTQTNYISTYTLSNDIYVPTISSYRQGVVFDVQPIISFDRKYVTVLMRPTLAFYDPTNSRVVTLKIISPIVVGNGTSTFVDTGNLTTHNLPLYLPVLKLTRIYTYATIPDGGTVLLGGLIKDANSEGVSGLPLISDIPVLGAFTKSTSRSREKTNTIIMVMAKIVTLED